jgi:alkanesulfonate monooxygenase SsuD/methylene tetrahydromethanopterin reductase-like flavin-dependent oxidoreductase (luciferase family)
MHHIGRRPGIGLSLPTWPRRDGTFASWPEMRQLARDAEAMGVDALWVPDHLLRVVAGRPPIGFRECWTVLTATAEATSRIAVGPFIACTGFRNPGLLAKMADTLDEVSGSRLVLAMGSGVPDTDESWHAFGFEPARHVGRYAESVEVVTRLLRGEVVTFHGDHVRTEGAVLLPRGPRRAGPPVWIAAKGPRTLGIAARWGDAVNVNTALAGPGDVATTGARVAEACTAAGRDPATLELTGWGRLALDATGRAVDRPGWLAGTPGEVASTIRSMGAAGLAHLTLYVGADEDPSPLPALTAPVLDRFAAVMEALGPATEDRLPGRPG